MARFVVPKTFNIFGSQYTVECRDQFTAMQEEGTFFPKQKRILLRVSPTEDQVPDAEIEQTFCHELVHAILDAIQEGELYNNEKFTELFGLALHQVLTSMK